MALALLDEDATITVKDSELGIEDSDEDTVYTLRVVSPQVIKRLRKAHSKKRPTGGQGMVDVLDTDAFGEALWDYVLHSWNMGAVLIKGQPVGADDIVATSAGNVKAKTLLDGTRKSALLELAGGNEVIADDRDASFRPPA